VHFYYPFQKIRLDQDYACPEFCVKQPSQ